MQAGAMSMGSNDPNAELSLAQIREKQKKNNDLLISWYGNSYGERFSHSIGVAYMIGVLSGGLYGFGEGLHKGGQTTKLRMNAVLNSVSTHGGHLGNQCGCMAFFYVPISKLYDFASGGEYDEFKAPVSGALSGALFKIAAKPAITARFAVAGMLGFSLIEQAYKMM